MTQSSKTEHEPLPEGPWSREPDRVEFRHAGLVCLLLRGPLGQWCGYVAVTPEHPWHGRDYSCADVKAEVHGGLTYADRCQGEICHVPVPGEPDDVWWFGFDCAHMGDLVPAMEQYRHYDGDVYRDMDYVRRETELLAEQLARAGGTAE